MNKSHAETHRQWAELAEERWRGHRELHEAKEEGIQAKLSGHWTLDDERWVAHSNQHGSIARNLSEYKAESNEWRATVTDLRTTFATASHLDGIEKEMERRYEDLRRMIATEREERRDQQNIRAGSQHGISQTLGVALAAIGLLATILSIVAISVGLFR